MIWLYAFVLPMLALLLVARLPIQRSHRSIVIWIVAYAPLSLLIGLREGVGRDYYSYVNDFYNINELELFYVEPGFYYLNRLAWFLNVGPTGVFLASSMIGFMLIWRRVASDSVNQLSSFVAMFGVGYVIFSLSAVRQVLAIAVFVYSVRYIWEGKLLKYFLAILFGGMFHFSIVVLLPFYYILRIKYTRGVLLLFLLLSIFAALSPRLYISLVGDFLSLGVFGDYAVYGERIQNVSVDVNTGIGLLAYLVVALIILGVDRSLKTESGIKDRVLAQSVLIGFCGYIFFSAVSDISRMFNYLTMVAILWHPNFIAQFVHRYNKVVFNVVLLFLWSALYIYPITFNPEILEPNLMPNFLG